MNVGLTLNQKKMWILISYFVLSWVWLIYEMMNAEEID